MPSLRELGHQFLQMVGAISVILLLSLSTQTATADSATVYECETEAGERYTQWNPCPPPIAEELTIHPPLVDPVGLIHSTWLARPYHAVGAVSCSNNHCSCGKRTTVLLSFIRDDPHSRAVEALENLPLYTSSYRKYSTTYERNRRKHGKPDEYSRAYIERQACFVLSYQKIVTTEHSALVKDILTRQTNESCQSVISATEDTPTDACSSSNSAKLYKFLDVDDELFIRHSEALKTLEQPSPHR